jgi:uncharacterized short protein YbdD (DUF466 family)
MPGATMPAAAVTGTEEPARPAPRAVPPATSRPTLRERLARVAAVVRRIIGVPDYATYLAHMRARYPHCTPMDRATFERERLVARYQRLGSRCC